MKLWPALVVCLLASRSVAQVPAREIRPKVPPPAPAKAPTPPAKPAPAPGGYTGLGAESVSPEDIARFAAPPLNEAVSRRIQAMLDVRGADSGFITSRGDRMLFTSRITGTSQVWLQDGPMRFPVQLTGGEDRNSVVGIAPDDSFALLSRDTGLSIQGVNDPRVPVGEALQLYKELAARKIPGGLILFPDEGHGAVKRDNQVMAYGHALAFFERHLMGK